MRPQLRATAVACAALRRCVLRWSSPRRYSRIRLDADGSLSSKQATEGFAQEGSDANPALATRPSPRWSHLVTFIAVVLVWAMVLGISPGLALIVIPLAVLAIDRYDQSLLDRLLGREGG